MQDPSRIFASAQCFRTSCTRRSVAAVKLRCYLYRSLASLSPWSLIVCSRLVLSLLDRQAQCAFLQYTRKINASLPTCIRICTPARPGCYQQHARNIHAHVPLHRFLVHVRHRQPLNDPHLLYPKRHHRLPSLVISQLLHLFIGHKHEVVRQ